MAPMVLLNRSVCLSVSVKWLAVKTASEMTYTVSSGALNSTPTPTLNRSVSENLTLWWKYLRLKQQETGWILSCHPANCFRALKETRPGTSVIGLSFSWTEKNWQMNSFLSDFNCKCRLFCTVWAYFLCVFLSENGIGPVFYFCRGVHGIFTYKSPMFSLVLFAVS